MGKQKQQQRPKRKKLTKVDHNKQRMKQVLNRLAQSKAKNKSIISSLTPISQSKAKSKAIEKKCKRFKANEHSAQNLQQDEIIQQQSQHTKRPTINIFAVDRFEAEHPVTINEPTCEKNIMENEADLQSRARKAMGQNFNIDKFGDKPLKIKEDQNSPVVLSDDEDQPNSSKVITHFNIKIPQGNKGINRKKQIQDIRCKLPIFMKQQQIIETINNHLVTLICGQTGSGKSTQLPQFLAQKNYEKLGKIGITQPRRLATISLARRVAEQMNCKIGNEVAYQVRHQRKQSSKSFIKFMTDGILLKQMSSDPLLLEYGVIIVDEAHQRKLNTDILIGLLSRLILVRYKMSQQQNSCNPLRLVVMSATLRVSDFQNPQLFNFFVPILKVEAKMFPVTIFHEKKTPDNYIDCAVKKCVKIHKQLPPGDVLIFLTGKQQIHQMNINLQLALKRLKIEEKEVNENIQEQQSQVKVHGQFIQHEQKLKNNEHQLSQFSIHNLYSSLPIEQQEKVFKQPKQGVRKFIISTNIAQTSITVPNVRYVVDSGQQKHRYFQQVWKWNKGWGSKAMALQRAGRAGRTTHGYCYRLYSSALYANIMQEHSQPQIYRLPLDNVVLEIKSIGFSNIFGFPFPSPPRQDSLLSSLQHLVQIGAIEGQIRKKKLKKNEQSQQRIRRNPSSQQKQQNNGQLSQMNIDCEQDYEYLDNCKITQLGKIISFIPLAPRLSKMLLLAHRLSNTNTDNIRKYILIIVVLLTIQSIYSPTQVGNNISSQNEEYRASQNDRNIHAKHQISRQLNQFRKRYSKFINKDCGSDLLVAMNITGQFLENIFRKSKEEKQQRSGQYGNWEQTSIHKILKKQSQLLHLNSNTMLQLYYNCDQICQIFESLTGISMKQTLTEYQQPTCSQIQTLLQILLSIYHQNLCRIQDSILQGNSKNRIKYVDTKNEQVHMSINSIIRMNDAKNYGKHPLFISCIDFYINDINSKKYMRYPFKVENYELLATFGSIKQTSEYVWAQEGRDGEVNGKAQAIVHGWLVPNIMIKSDQLSGQGKYYAMARFFLSGQIFESLAVLQQKKWLKAPISSIRPDNLKQNVQRLVNQFRNNKILTKHKLIIAMKNNHHFLQKQLQSWLNVKNYAQVYQLIRNSIIKS